MLIVTTNDLPGHRIIQVHGLVTGFYDLSNNVHGRGLSLGSESAIREMESNALKLGANAVVATRFETFVHNELFVKISAYGTAVTVASL